MLDKRLYRDVSDLLELSVSDDKIVRILLVRGYTTEQIKRSIREIRSKGTVRHIAEMKPKSTPISETIETGPSKRFGFLNKLFKGNLSEEEMLAEEAQRLASEESKLKAEETKIQSELQSVIEKAKGLSSKEIAAVPEDVRQVLRFVDELLGKLPEKDVKTFVESPQFAKYKRVMKKYAT